MAKSEDLEALRHAHYQAAMQEVRARAAEILATRNRIECKESRTFIIARCGFSGKRLGDGALPS